ncbi:type VI secretion system contractile sheath small subunit [Acanthopleuribacter pedis]|uniref:Type VI secretion system contractile sheath small subunit n=1 Tax=Acanthopleuribacter pedis TaxID=442870 RepID=A0A8J7QMG5_9BACT|nr:type VI secretion system contractile sheath small subunit [Acanthopleuribacter pedis]MBO1321083.1 type VI secretion system contractile sheath small subunit [Acanthopleuribacter pedis]
MSNTQHKLDNLRAPRVHITYDVEVGDNTESKELPFVAGVLADLSGDGNKELPSLKQRKFTEIDGENFNKVMRSAEPSLNFRVANKLTGDGRFEVKLQFKELEDFNPTRVVNQIEPLRELLETRTKLKDLISKLDGNEELDGLLQEVINNTTSVGKLKDELGGNHE